LHRHDAGVHRLDPIVASRRDDRDRLLLLGVVFVVPGFLLLQDVLDRLDVGIPGLVRRCRGVLEVLLGRLEVVEVLGGLRLLVLSLVVGLCHLFLSLDPGADSSGRPTERMDPWSLFPQRGQAKARETFGAATPGRRVLYSASRASHVTAGAVTQVARYRRHAPGVNPNRGETVTKKG